ncbi:hypothetical protein FSARC_7268 [Fusarium sarcochroum]|uniref:Methyltransferase n=1 Tax=Fusarium sarcochroum TaxID=1208366 RepID=A0A8H4TVQ4_9HYPO|nr:hypothetical protein FSARC_7268 [Fusarium sarcochroum]
MGNPPAAPVSFRGIDLQNTPEVASHTQEDLEPVVARGRTFHSEKYDTYFTPNDEQQMDSIDITHHYLTLLHDGKLSLAPLRDDLEASYIRCYQHPNAEVIGTDLSPIQPSWVPSNVRFEIEDATSDWSWPDNHFDFVHMRYLIGAIPDWGALFKEAFRCCKPGGFIESAEVNPTFYSDDETTYGVTAIQKWNYLCSQGGPAFARNFTEVENDVELLQAAGFVDIQVKDFKIPVGGWAKDPKLRLVGQFLRATIANDLEGYTLVLAQQILKWPQSEYQLFLMEMRKALKDNSIHGYLYNRFITARKPEGGQ